MFDTEWFTVVFKICFGDSRKLQMQGKPALPPEGVPREGKNFLSIFMIERDHQKGVWTRGMVERDYNKDSVTW